MSETQVSAFGALLEYLCDIDAGGGSAPRQTQQMTIICFQCWSYNDFQLLT
jgi:hypothetical protein